MRARVGRGRALAIRTFREHHLDEKAIVGHDFVETNGHNFALSVPLSLADLHVASALARACLLATAFFVAMTSQIHKWAHMERPPRAVAVLPRWRLILSAAHHDGHHAAPHTRNYCITCGWLDRPLRALRVFEALERAISALTGWTPRDAGDARAPLRAR